jgi:hypothetical protein
VRQPLRWLLCFWQEVSLLPWPASSSLLRLAQGVRLSPNSGGKADIQETSVRAIEPEIPGAASSCGFRMRLGSGTVKSQPKEQALGLIENEQITCFGRPCPA